MYGRHVAATLLTIRELHGAIIDDRAVRLAARVGLRMVLDEIDELVCVGLDCPDLALLCTAALWLDLLASVPETWPRVPVGPYGSVDGDGGH